MTKEPVIPQGKPAEKREEGSYPSYPQYTGYEYREEELDLGEILAAILRRKWTVLSFLLLVFMTTAIVTFRMKPVYRATATVEVSFEEPQALPFRQNPQARIIEQVRYIETQVEILKSKTLAEKVIYDLNLEESKEFIQEEGLIAKTVAGIKKFLSSIFAGGGSEKIPVDPETAKKIKLVDEFLKRLKVDTVKRGKTYLLSVSFEAHDPELCAKVVNTLVDEYVEFDLEKRVKAARVGKQYLEKQIAKVQAKLEQAEERLNEFARKNNIVFLEGGQNAQDIVTARLSQLTDELVKAQAERMRLESIYKQSLVDPESVPQVMNDTLIKELKKKLSELKAEYADMATVFTDRYPKMKMLKEQISSIEKQIEREKRKILNSIRTQYLASLKQEKMIRSALDVEKKKLAELKQKAIDYNILKREVETNRKIYEMLLERAKEMDVEASVSSTNIHPIDRAFIPLTPYKPKKALNLGLALLVGLFGGIALALVMERLDNTIKSPDEVERIMGIPVLGIVPSVSEEKAKDNHVDLYAVRRPKSPAAEAFRMIRTSLTLATPSSPPKTILITSPQVGGGKTFISLNLAAVYAQLGSRVVLVDCDLRKSRLHRILEVKGSPGLSNYLAGSIDVKSIITSVNGRLGDNIDVSFIPAGTVPPNPVELLNSKPFEYLIELLKKEYDHIILDSPPLIGFADALVLSRLADGTILVIRNERTPKPAARHAVSQIRQVGGKILGAILNDVKASRKGYYYYSKHYYYYYHDYYDRYYGQEYEHLPKD